MKTTEELCQLIGEQKTFEVLDLIDRKELLNAVKVIRETGTNLYDSCHVLKNVAKEYFNLDILPDL